ncbi:MAG: FAD-dependent oxidoreductase [Polyangia bacterium]
MNGTANGTAFDVIVIGGGQAGLSVGYHLARRGLRFVILDANLRVGDSWRRRWDSLRLFSPARLDGLDGMPFPAPPNTNPTKDEMASYLEAYAARFELPVLTGVTVTRLARDGERFLVEAGARRFQAAQVVVAMADYQRPHVPDFARQLNPGIVQLHVADYKGPAQLRPGGVLLVGAGNSGAEIGIELASGADRVGHPVWLSGRHPGHIPFRSEGLLARLFLLRFIFRVVFHRLLSVSTPIGRKVRRKASSGGAPLIRQRPKELAAAGIKRTARTVGVRDGLPLLDDGRTLDVTNVIWCTGFHAGFSWIDLPVFDNAGRPRHVSGIATDVPGLYFVGLHFLHALSSSMIHGVGRDAARISDAVAARAAQIPSPELVARRLIDEGFSKGQLAVADALVADEFIEHQSRGPAHPGGAAGVRDVIAALRRGFSDFELSIEQVAVAGDMVWMRNVATGTHDGPFMGHAATGRSIQITVFDVMRVVGGRIVEHWGVADRASVLFQIGALAPPQQAPSAAQPVALSTAALL